MASIRQRSGAVDGAGAGRCSAFLPVRRDRRSPSLGWSPDHPVLLKDFPARRLSPEVRLLRIVRAGVGPWWFGSSLAGRFDLPEPDGTCYLAADEIAALLELLAMDREEALVPSEF